MAEAIGARLQGSALRLQVRMPGLGADGICPLTPTTRSLGAVTHPPPLALSLLDAVGSEAMVLRVWTSVFLNPGQIEADTYGSYNPPSQSVSF